MKKLLLCPLLLALVSCSGDEAKSTAADSATQTVAGASETVLQTDTGKIVVKLNGEASLYDPNGKLRGSGYFTGGKPAGAWLRYDEQGNIISAEHFSNDGTPVRQLDKNDFEFRSWTVNGFGARFSIPKNWKELPSANPALLASFSKEVQDDSVFIRPSVNIVKAQLQPGETIDKLAEMQMNILHQKFPRVEPVGEEYFTVDSCQGFRRYGKYENGNKQAGYLNAIIVSGNSAWLISCEAQNVQGEFLLYQGVFHRITESFRRSR